MFAAQNDEITALINFYGALLASIMWFNCEMQLRPSVVFLLCICYFHFFIFTLLFPFVRFVFVLFSFC